jgi:hypothetical protein
MTPQLVDENTPKDRHILLYGVPVWSDPMTERDTRQWVIAHWNINQAEYCRDDGNGWVTVTNNPYCETVHDATHWCELPEVPAHD